MDRILRVGIIGYGYASATFHAPLIKAVRGLSLAAIASRHPEKVHADHQDLLVEPSPATLIANPDIDLIVVASPNETHFALARLALNAGKHVVVDKPFTVTLTQAQELKNQAERTGRVLSVFHNRRWDSDFLTLKKILESGQLGRIVHYESHFDRYRPQVKDRWRERSEPGAGLWFDLGSHLIDQAIQLFGMPDSMHVDLALQRSGAQVDDWFHAILRYGPMRAILHASALVARPSIRFTVHGEQGSFCKNGIDPQEESLKQGKVPGSVGWGEDSDEAVLSLPGAQDLQIKPERGNYLAYYEGIRDAILGGATAPVTADQAIAVMSLISAGIHPA